MMKLKHREVEFHITDEINDTDKFRVSEFTVPDGLLNCVALWKPLI